MATNFPHLYDGREKKKKQLSIKPGYTERRKFSLQLAAVTNQHALSKLFHQLYQLKCQHFRVVVAILGGERGGSVVECRTPEREVRGSRPTAAVLCP